MYGSVPFKDLESLGWAVTDGRNPDIEGEYDYWDHVDFVLHYMQLDIVDIK